MRFKIPKLSHPWAKNAAGFTLVELVVVIAILGVLAGVGTVGYSGYVKHAQKNNDKTLISNIVRAIEIGNSSYAHELSEVLQPGEEGIQIPIGFIVVSKNGIAGQDGVYTQVYESATRKETVTSTICQKSAEPVQFYKSGGSYPDTIEKKDCFNNTSTETKEIHTVVADGDPIYICTTHSSAPKNETWITGKNNKGDDWVTQSYPSKAKSKVYEATGDHTPGNNLEGFEEEIYAPGQFDAAEGGVLHNALVDAFGAIYPQELKLQSDKWTESTLPTFYAAAPDMWGAVETLAGTLYTLSGGAENSEWGTKSHDSAADLVYDFANEVAGNSDSGVTMTEEIFMDYWKNIGTRNEDISDEPTYGGYAFGFNLREDYAAARKAYNACFASYVKVTPASVPHANYSDNKADTHAAAIQEYGKPVLDIDVEGVLPELPQLVCQDAFDKDDSRLDVKNCPACQELYKKYISTGADVENGKTLYDTMITVSNTDERVVKGLIDKNGEEVSFFDYYNRYLDEFNGMYSSVYNEVKDGSCVAICVYLKDGFLSYVVSPSEAYASND